MKPVFSPQDELYFASIQDAKLYIDYTNERLKILDYRVITDHIIGDIIDFAISEGLGKIIANCPLGDLNSFRNNSFIIEGLINNFFAGEDGYCMSYFIDSQRRNSPHKKIADIIRDQCLRDPQRFVKSLKQDYLIRTAEERDIPELIRLFSAVFASYPSPVFQSEYLRTIMTNQVLFKVAEQDSRIISMASADMDQLNLNAEITDCATYTQHQGRAILPHLISSLEADLVSRGFHTAYSLARAINPGINKALGRLGYVYSGRLINNCHICGSFEDMNVWVKPLQN